MENAPSPAGSRTTLPTPVERGSRESRDQARDRIRACAQTATEASDLYARVGRILGDLGMRCYIVERDHARDDFIVLYAGMDGRSRRAVERAVAQPIEGLRLGGTILSPFSDRFSRGRAVLLERPCDDLVVALPHPSPAVTRRLARLMGVEHAVVAPMLLAGASLGVLAVFGADLTDTDVPLIEDAATYLGSAVAASQGRRVTQRREAAARALGTISALVTAGTAPEALPALAVRAIREPLGADSAAVWMLETPSSPDHREPVLRLAAQDGTPDDAPATGDEITVSASCVVAEAVRKGMTVALAEADDGAGRAIAPHRFPYAIASPLRAGGRIIGALALTLTRERTASAEETAFVEAFATQMAGALENARLVAETRAQTLRARLLADLAVLLGSSLDPATLLTTLVEQTAQALGGCVAVYLPRPQDDEFTVAAIHHPNKELLARIRQGLSAVPPRVGVGVFGQAYAERRPLLARFGTPEISESQRIYAVLVNAVSSIGAPLNARGQCLGVLSLSSFQGDRPYDTADLALAETIAGLAAQALDNARVYAAAEEGRRQLAATFDSMVESVFLYDADGRVIDLNEAGVRLLGLRSRHDALRPAADYVQMVEMRHPDGRPMLVEDVASLRAVRGATVVGFEEVIRHLVTAEERYLIVNAAPIRDDSGGITGAVLVAHDVTELRAAERVKDEFLSVASHELKTPLTPLKGFVQIIDAMLARDDDTTHNHARMRRYVHMMSGRVDRLASLVDEMLDFSRLQLGRFVLQIAPTDLAALADDVLVGFEHDDHGRARHELVLHAPEPVVVACDPRHVEQVLTNLISNAIKFSPRGGAVTVRVEKDGATAVLTIEDQGIGIPADEERLLFQPFMRGSNAPALQYGGIGLGLYICREIVERHGGRITVRPCNPSADEPGTCARVVLPVAGPTS